MAFRIQLRRDTQARWASNNPVLLLGEFGYEYDTGLAKIGDGNSPWNDLDYFVGGTSGINEFTELQDTPSSYTGATASFVTVNDSADGLAFKTQKQAANVLNILQLSGYGASDAYKLVQVNAGGTGLEFNSFIGSTGSYFYTNANSSENDVGGILTGSIFNNVNEDDLWNAMLYPSFQPSFATVSITPDGGGTPYTDVEIGTSLDAALDFNWTSNNSGDFSTNSVSVRDVTNAMDIISNVAESSSPGNYTYGTQVGYNTVNSHTWEWRAISNNGRTFIKRHTVNWYYPVFSGRADYTELNTALLTALANRDIMESPAGTYTFLAENPADYIYICIPDSYDINTMEVNGIPLATADDSPYTNSGPGGLRYDLINSVNINGVSTTYRAYRSKNKLAGPITIVVT